MNRTKSSRAILAASNNTPNNATDAFNQDFQSYHKLESAQFIQKLGESPMRIQFMVTKCGRFPTENPSLHFVLSVVISRLHFSYLSTGFATDSSEITKSVH